jgi:hypothetical protein
MNKILTSKLSVAIFLLPLYIGGTTVVYNSFIISSNEKWKKIEKKFEMERDVERSFKK